MDKLSLLLDGKKTYIAIALLFILGGLHAVGLVDDNTYKSLLPLLGGAVAFGLRKAVK